MENTRFDLENRYANEGLYLEDFSKLSKLESESKDLRKLYDNNKKEAALKALEFLNSFEQIFDRVLKYYNIKTGKFLREFDKDVMVNDIGIDCLKIEDDSNYNFENIMKSYCELWERYQIIKKFIDYILYDVAESDLVSLFSGEPEYVINILEQYKSFDSQITFEEMEKNIDLVDYAINAAKKINSIESEFTESKRLGRYVRQEKFYKMKDTFKEQIDYFNRLYVCKKEV